jgi:hypothetical protein
MALPAVCRVIEAVETSWLKRAFEGPGKTTLRFAKTIGGNNTGVTEHTQLQRSDYGLTNVPLHRKGIFNDPVEASKAAAEAIAGITHSNFDTKVLRCVPHTSLQQHFHSQHFSNVANVHTLVFQLKYGTTRHHPDSGNISEHVNELFAQAVAEQLAGGIGAEIQKRKQSQAFDAGTARRL